MGEMLLRPAPLVRVCFPDAPQSVRRTATLFWNCPGRAISNSSIDRTAQTQPKTDDSSAPPAPRSTSADVGDIDEILGSVDSPAFRRPITHYSRSSQPSSATEFKKAANAAKNVFGDDWSQNKGTRRPQGLQVDALADMDSLSSLPHQSTTPYVDETKKVYPRLTPAYGRTIELDENRGRDLVRAIGMLGTSMARNKVRYDFMKQRFHERPGLKRKRLKSERWRARFKEGFAHVTSRVTELTKKGW